MLYLVADARPSVRVGGALQLLDDEPVLDARDLAPLLMNVAPGSSPSALDAAAGGTWTSEFDGIGRVHGAIFRDRRGPVGILRIVPHAPLPEWLDLPPEIQAFAAEDDGLVLVAGPRSSGKRTLLAALVDRVNRTRCAHVITIGQGDGIAHASRQSVVSQRDVTGGDEDMLAAARGALREAPDVLVLDAIRTAELMNVALDAAASGCLVFGGLLARNATAAIDRAVTLCAPAHASRARLCLAEHRLAEHRLAEYLRGVVAQRLVPRAGGGCLAVREVLANTPALADAIANGRSPDAA
jgi:twitching motility protein PilT